MAQPEAATSGGPPPDPRGPSVLVIGCGALARELLAVVARNQLQNIRIECLPAILHNRPEKIPDAVRARLESAGGFDQVFVAYGDCGTGGALDEVLSEFGVERLPGPHCYQFFAGASVFDEMHEEEPGTLYLTDYLTRHFDRLIWRGLGLDRHPELLGDYFGNYKRIVYLAQTSDSGLAEGAREAASQLGLEFEQRFVGYGEMEPELVRVALRGEPPSIPQTTTIEGGPPPSNPPTTHGLLANAGIGVSP